MRKTFLMLPQEGALDVWFKLSNANNLDAVRFPERLFFIFCSECLSISGVLLYTAVGVFCLPSSLPAE